MDLKVDTNDLSKLPNAAIIILSIGVSIGIMTIGVLIVYMWWIEPQLHKLKTTSEVVEKKVNDNSASDLAFKKAIISDPAVARTLQPETKRKIEQQLEKNVAEESVMYSLDVDSFYKLGKTIIEDNFGRYYQATFISDIFLIDSSDPFPTPKNREEVTFAEQVILNRYYKSIFDSDKRFKPLMLDVSKLERVTDDMIAKYKNIEDRKSK